MDVRERERKKRMYQVRYKRWYAKHRDRIIAKEKARQKAKRNGTSIIVCHCGSFGDVRKFEKHLQSERHLINVFGPNWRETYLDF